MSKYRVWIRTSDVDSAGTDAHVYFTIHGANHSSPERFLDDPDIDNWEQGTLDQFNLDFPDLGEIKSIRIRHDNHGRHPGWRLDHIDIQRDEDPNAYWRVDIDRWLSKEVGDKKTDLTCNAVRRSPVYTAKDGRHGTPHKPHPGPSYTFDCIHVYVEGHPLVSTIKAFQIEDNQVKTQVALSDGATTLLVRGSNAWWKKFGTGEAILPGNGQYEASIGDYSIIGSPLPNPPPPHGQLQYVKKLHS